MTLFKKVFMSLAVALALPMTASAQIELPQAAGFAGLSAGFADPTNLDGRFGFGADVGLMFPSNWSASLFFLSSAADQDGVDTEILHYGLGGDYFMELPAGRVTVGGRIGLGTVTASAGEIDDESTEFSVGPHVGYDYPITDKISVGADSSLLFTFGDNAVSTLYVLGSAKYWF